MPAMPRLPGKAKRIAFKILGTPPPMRSKRTKQQRKINARLVFEETSRVR